MSNGPNDFNVINDITIETRMRAVCLKPFLFPSKPFTYVCYFQNCTALYSRDFKCTAAFVIHSQYSKIVSLFR